MRCESCRCGLPLSDKGSHASAVDAYPRQHERSSRPATAASLARRQERVRRKAKVHSPNSFRRKRAAMAGSQDS